MRTVRPLFCVKTAYSLFRRTLVPLSVHRRAYFYAFAANKGSPVRKLAEIGSFVTISVSCVRELGEQGGRS
ncbi:hypothetical protein [Paenibacillus sp. MSJ-34]|uniref:hypothetical protein n=1 Tax=Paenibacillus sp. MSJ-34 TaxID=2841529 RepID=UPI001C0FEAC1|nr:hypothetical protein [Paenibacillus sp. MSJ-34]MBU5442386.1 hypothetical protein [Paenibacillus sp. MSJ-34]